MGLAGLTAVFGMGTGVAPPVWSPESRPAGGQAVETERELVRGPWQRRRRVTVQRRQAVDAHRLRMSSSVLPQLSLCGDLVRPGVKRVEFQVLFDSSRRRHHDLGRMGTSLFRLGSRYVVSFVRPLF